MSEAGLATAHGLGGKLIVHCGRIAGRAQVQRPQRGRLRDRVARGGGRYRGDFRRLRPGRVDGAHVGAAVGGRPAERRGRKGRAGRGRGGHAGRRQLEGATVTGGSNPRACARLEEKLSWHWPRNKEERLAARPGLRELSRAEDGSERAAGSRHALAARAGEGDAGSPRTPGIGRMEEVWRLKNPKEAAKSWVQLLSAAEYL